MQTHLDLIYDQLDFLTNILVEETGALFCDSDAWTDWQYEDIQALAQTVDVAAQRFLTVPQFLQDGYSPYTVGTALDSDLRHVLERSAALLNDESLPHDVARRLQQINSTGYDMLTIVTEIFDL